MGSQAVGNTFAIVVPVYNGKEYVREAVYSALAQRRPADEIVVVDDASTDGTAEVLGDFVQQMPACAGALRIVGLPERVPAPAAWNEAVRQTSSRFVVVLAHDDRLHPDFLLEAERAIRKHPATDLFICGYEVIDAMGASLGQHEVSLYGYVVPGPVPNRGYLNRFTRGGQFFLPTGVVMARSLFDCLGGFNTELKVAYDWEFFLRAGVVAQIYIDNRTLVHYRVHGSQSIGAHTRSDNGDSDRIFRNLRVIASGLSPEQSRWLVGNMCDFLRRFGTWPIADPRLPARAAVDQRGVIARKLAMWRAMDSPYSRYVTVEPRNWRQWLMWNLGRNALGVLAARALLKVVTGRPELRTAGSLTGSLQ
jgi:glycosyltransferase involved in cell wall biosynthesis